jgi:hypothetical protein
MKWLAGETGGRTAAVYGQKRPEKYIVKNMAFSMKFYTFKAIV